MSEEGIETPAPIVQVVADLDDGTRPAGVGVRGQIHTFAQFVALGNHAFGTFAGEWPYAGRSKGPSAGEWPY